MRHQRFIITAGIVSLCVGISVVVIMGVNLIPKETTEIAKIVFVDQSGCTVETSDGFDINIGQCTGKVGDMINATFDSNIRERYAATHLNGG